MLAKSYRQTLALLVALALIRGLIYLSVFPPWQAPDEPAHFEVVRAVAQQGQIPSKIYYNSEPVNAELAQSLSLIHI